MPETAKLRILSLEDQPRDAELILAELKLAGVACEFHRVDKEPDFMAALAAGGYDLVLADNSLPGYDGQSALRFCREKYPALPFIFVSGSLGEEGAVETLKNGATDYVLKDRLERLPSVVERAVREAADRAARQNAEAALRASEEKFSKAFQSTPDAMVISRRNDGVLIDVNEGFKSVLGYSREEALGKNSVELGIWLDPADRKAFLAKLDQNAAVDGLEFPFMRKGGERRFGIFSARPMELNCELMLVMMIRDVTESKLLEQQLRQAQKMESVGQLAAGVAHDFNNLLTVIQGNGEMLLDELQGRADLVETLNEVLSASEKAASLTRQLLMFSRRQVMQSHPVNLSDLAANLTKMFSRVLREDIKLDFSFASDLPMISGDAGMIEQVLMNLVVNARDAMPEGGLLVIETSMVELGSGVVREGVDARAGTFVRLIVRDTGCGIPPENLARIFEPFFTTKEVGKGTGLGLASVFGIIKQHQGWVEVDSQVGVGTQFSVYLPVASRESVETKTASITTRPGGGHETILVVEDDASVLKIASDTLKRRGYKILTSSSGADAWQHYAARADTIDLLLTDIVMPGGLNGLDLADKLKGLKANLRVIYTSGYSEDMLQRGLASQAGVVFLPKPYQMDHLARLVRQSLDQE